MTYLRIKTPLMTIAGALVISACSSSQDQHNTAVDQANQTHGETETHHDEGDGQVHWGYEGDQGPAQWGSLSEEFATCGTGNHQSPIDLPADTANEPEGMSFEYAPSALRIINNGHTIQANFDPGSFLVLGEQRFELLQLHFHAGSEHTVSGQQHDLEVHLVHRNQAGELAVVGIFFEPGETNAFLAPIWENIPTDVGSEHAVEGATINATDILPSSQRSWRYHGSLTTPPFTEGGRWNVMAESASISAEQLEAFRGLYNNNFRPPQPLNDRSFE